MNKQYGMIHFYRGNGVIMWGAVNGEPVQRYYPSTTLKVARYLFEKELKKLAINGEVE